MLKKQPLETLEKNAPKKKTSSASKEAEKKTPSTELVGEEDFSAFLQETEAAVERAKFSEEETNQKAKKLMRARELVGRAAKIRERRLQRTADEFRFLEGLTSSDYARLVKEGFINEKEAENLQKAETLLSQLEQLKYPTVEDKKRFEKIKEYVAKKQRLLDDMLQEARMSADDYLTETGNKITAHYEKRIAQLKRIIAELEKDPRVKGRVEELQREAEEKRLAELRKERDKLLDRWKRYAQSLGERHNNAFNAIKAALGEKDGALVQKLREAVLDKTKRYQKETKELEKHVREKIFDAVREGLDPGDIIRWIRRGGKKYAVDYRHGMDVLGSETTWKMLKDMRDAAENDRKRKQLENFLAVRERLVRENNLLRELLLRRVFDKGSNKRRLAIFLEFEAATEKKQKSDQPVSKEKTG